MPVHLGFQGGVHTFVTVRTTGFPSAATASFSIEITLEEDGTAIVSRRTLATAFNEITPGVNEAQDIFIRFENAGPDDLDGLEAVLFLSVTDLEDESVSASLTQTVLLAEMDAS